MNIYIFLNILISRRCSNLMSVLFILPILYIYFYYRFNQLSYFVSILHTRKSESWHGEYKINKAFLPGFGHTWKGRLHSSSSDPCQTHGSDFRDQLLSATDSPARSPYSSTIGYKGRPGRSLQRCPSKLEPKVSPKFCVVSLGRCTSYYQ